MSRASGQASGATGSLAPPQEPWRACCGLVLGAPLQAASRLRPQGAAQPAPTRTPVPWRASRQASRVITAGTARWSHPDRKMTPGKEGGSQSPACIGQSGPAATRVATRSASISSISAADATPPCWKRACQTWALWRDTPSSWATSAWVRPWANNSADCSRRASRAARSWAGSGRRVVGIAGRSHTTSPAVNPTHETQKYSSRTFGEVVRNRRSARVATIGPPEMATTPLGQRPPTP
jgi:hypothetical protein